MLRFPFPWPCRSSLFSSPARLARFSSLAICVALAAIGASAACSSSSGNGVLQAADLSLPEGGAFDPTTLISDAAFVDTSPADLSSILQFLQKTPYDQPSFLATYVSNGVTAALAIVQSSQKYRINPLVFLAEAERAQGLVGSRAYPFPSSRVEFVFGCGCTAPGQCDIALGGFDKQVDCLGRALRTSFDQAAGQSQATDGGWAIGKATTTIDGVPVAPTDASTCALYQYLPLVGDAKSGNRLFFAVYQLYATALNYFDPGM